MYTWQRASHKSLDASYGSAQNQACFRLAIYSILITLVLTVNVTLAFVSLSHEEIGHMSSDPILVADCIAAKNFLKSV